MIISVMSDSHDNIDNLRWAVGESLGAACDLIIHCGDFVAPFMLAELDQAAVPVHGVFGNNDGDQYLMTRNALTRHSHIELHGQFGQLEAGGRRVGFMHDGTLADDIAAGGRFDLLCFGHIHVYLEKMVGKTLVLNPGELLGKEGPPGFCLVDTGTMTVTRVVRQA